MRNKIECHFFPGGISCIKERKTMNLEPLSPSDWAHHQSKLTVCKSCPVYRPVVSQTMAKRHYPSG